jgi:hypothetical protein
MAAARVLLPLPGEHHLLEVDAVLLVQLEDEFKALKSACLLV